MDDNTGCTHGVGRPSALKDIADAVVPLFGLHARERYVVGGVQRQCDTVLSGRLPEFASRLKPYIDPSAALIFVGRKAHICQIRGYLHRALVARLIEFIGVSSRSKQCFHLSTSV
ncbi:hypothetical protein SDC9_208918 [bioreactor metagenome]|uniref:Uncharacterized protein n=1 Tax=bioreactor metagenome TaxID=1076179 RepID=A0A645JLI6_9ZZZZ